MENIGIFLSENFHFLVVNFSIYLNRHVFVMLILYYTHVETLQFISYKLPAQPRWLSWMRVLFSKSMFSIND